MENRWDISLAIVSDLHCHDERFAPPESWLIAGASRKPAGHHPIQALIAIIRQVPISADVVVCPGDLANRISRVGMMQSWDHLCELKRELNADLLITTLGNHDVDCHNTYNPDPFHIPRTLHDTFPAPTEAALQDFWMKGFYVVDGPPGTEFLVLNTVNAHHDHATAKRGTFDSDHINRLDDVLTERTRRRSTTSPIRHRIAVMHHHPLLHSSTRFSASDVLEYGDQLLSVLSQHDYRFVVHGHRHEPRITRISSARNEQFVFASGSFSAILNELSTRTRNLFHLVRLRIEEPRDRLVGEILTWEFNKGVGWRESTTASAIMPHVARFSSPRLPIPIEEMRAACLSAPGAILRAAELAEKFPALGLLLPDELAALSDHLLTDGIKLVLGANGTPNYLGTP
jgi:predicted phosphodiesterase